MSATPGYFAASYTRHRLAASKFGKRAPDLANVALEAASHQLQRCLLAAVATALAV